LFSITNLWVYVFAIVLKNREFVIISFLKGNKLDGKSAKMPVKPCMLEVF